MIIDIIQNQLNILKELNNILDREIEVLKVDEGYKLANIIEDKKKVVLELSKIEKLRRDACGNKGLSELVEAGEIGIEIEKEFRDVIKDIERKNEISKLLTKQSLGYIRMFNQVLSGENMVVTYKESGKLDEKLGTTFTTKV